MEDPKATILVGSDFHIPYHDEAALNLFLKAASELQPTHIVINGDFWDFWKISRHDKNSAHRRTSMAQELEDGEAVLKWLSLQCRKLHFIEGNHDVRLSKYIEENAGELAVLAEKRGFALRAFVKACGAATYTKYKDALRLYNTVFTHDLEKSGQYSVHQAANDTQKNVILGHSHVGDVVCLGDALTGEPQVAASFGWLGSYEMADYRHSMMAKRKWAHGFGYGIVDGRNHVHWQPCWAANKRVAVAGKVLKV